MQVFEDFRAFVQRISRLISNIGMFLLIPLMLLTSCEVVSRAAWNLPLPGTIELSSYLLAVFVLLGLAYTQQVKGHVRATMLVERLPVKVAVSLDVASTLLSMFIVALLAWQGWKVSLEETTVSDMLRIPQWPFRFLVAVAAILLWLELLFDLVAGCRKLARR